MNSDHYDHRNEDELLTQMARVILSDILKQVIREFEQTTGTEIGAIHISPTAGPRHERKTEMVIRRTGKESLEGLMRFKKILCEHEFFRDNDFCRFD
jgi:hypothetical protein